MSKIGLVSGFEELTIKSDGINGPYSFKPIDRNEITAWLREQDTRLARERDEAVKREVLKVLDEIGYRGELKMNEIYWINCTWEEYKEIRSRYTGGQK